MEHGWISTTPEQVFGNIAFVEKVTTELIHASAKGIWLLVLHIDNEDGFIKTGLVESKKSTDYQNYKCIAFISICQLSTCYRQCSTLLHSNWSV